MASNLVAVPSNLRAIFKDVWWDLVNLHISLHPESAPPPDHSNIAVPTSILGQ